MGKRSNAVLIGLAVLVAALAVLAAVSAGNRESRAPDTSTPDGVVRAFLAAVIDGDDDAAVSLLAPSMGCAAPLPSTGAPESATLSVVSSRTAGSSAQVTMEISEGPGAGAILGEPYTHRESYTLVRSGGRWLIDGQPWPLYSCKDR